MTVVLLTRVDPLARYLARFGKSPSNRYAAGLLSVLARMKNDIIPEQGNEDVLI